MFLSIQILFHLFKLEICILCVSSNQKYNLYVKWLAEQKTRPLLLGKWIIWKGFYLICVFWFWCVVSSWPNSLFTLHVFQWCQLKNRKENLRTRFQMMAEYQGDLIMKDLDAPLPENMRMLKEEDMERWDALIMTEKDWGGHEEIRLCMMSGKDWRGGHGEVMCTDNEWNYLFRTGMDKLFLRVCPDVGQISDTTFFHVPTKMFQEQIVIYLLSTAKHITTGQVVHYHYQKIRSALIF